VLNNNLEARKHNLHDEIFFKNASSITDKYNIVHSHRWAPRQCQAKHLNITGQRGWRWLDKLYYYRRALNCCQSKKLNATAKMAKLTPITGQGPWSILAGFLPLQCERMLKVHMMTGIQCESKKLVSVNSIPSLVTPADYEIQSRMMRALFWQGYKLYAGLFIKLRLSSNNYFHISAPALPVNPAD